jgi:hypothetical protein
MYKGDKQMKIYKKNKKIESTLEETRKAIDAAPEDMQEMDDTTVQFTEEEIMTLKDVLPKIVQLLTGEATIEVIEDDEDMEMEEPEEMDEVEELGQGDQEVTLPEDEDMEMEEAKDEATFDAMAVLNDPKKKAALIEALKGQKTTAQKVGDMMEPKAEDKNTPAKKVFVKKTLPKKAGDEKPVVKKPNSELVKTPVVRKVGDSATTTVRTFDFHKK